MWNARMPMASRETNPVGDEFGNSRCSGCSPYPGVATNGVMAFAKVNKPKTSSTLIPVLFQLPEGECFCAHGFMSDHFRWLVQISPNDQA
jgi:hypothetical protein